MDLGVTDKVKPLIDKVRQMVSDDIEPLDQEFHEEVGKHPSCLLYTSPSPRD